jgi:hypothetical protein
MAFAYSAQFSKPLLLQTVAIIQRDQAAAIAAVNSSLNQIAEFHFGRGPRTALPWLAITADGPRFIENDDLSYREGHAILTLDLDAAPIDQETAQQNAHDYARILDMILTSAGPFPSLADWTTVLSVIHPTAPSGSTSPNAVGTIKDVMVLDHKYTAASAEGYSSPLVRASLNVRFHLIEG